MSPCSAVGRSWYPQSSVKGLWLQLRSPTTTTGTGPRWWVWLIPPWTCCSWTLETLRLWRRVSCGACACSTTASPSRPSPADWLGSSPKVRGQGYHYCSPLQQYLENPRGPAYRGLLLSMHKMRLCSCKTDFPLTELLLTKCHSTVM